MTRTCLILRLARMPASLLILAVLGGARPALADETPDQLFTVSVDRIWDRAKHNAFTDLLRHEGALYCTFREGSGHIPGLNGTIRVLRSADGTRWQSVALLEEPHVDLRDPKLSVTPDGRLMINMGASYYHGSERRRIESRVAFADSGTRSFGKPQKVELPESILTGFDWLWRVTWHRGQAWGCVQQVPTNAPRALHLVRSKDAIHYEHVAKLPVEYPSETTLRFQDDDTLLAMIRVQSKTRLGLVGAARPPYTDWKLTPATRSFSGPNFMALPGGVYLAEARGSQENQATTELFWLDVQTGQCQDIVILPSGGDTSYAGLVPELDQGRLLVSYYSSHEGKAAIYLATLRLDAMLAARKQKGDQ